MEIIATVMTNFTAILMVNIQDDSKIINIKVKINSFNCTTFSSHPVQISGLVVAYYSTDVFKADSKLMITNFYYNNTYNSCRNHFYCVVVLIFQKITCSYEDGQELNLRIHIQNFVFSNFKNSSALCYYGEAAAKCYVAERSRAVIIENSTFSNNIGHPQLNMIYIVLNTLSTSFNILVPSLRRQKSLYVAVRTSTYFDNYVHR